MMTKKNALALFDFDGTITTDDSFMEFMKFAVGNIRFRWGLFRYSPWLLAFSAGLVSSKRMKEMVMTYFFKGWDTQRFNSTAHEFAAGKLKEFVKASAMERIAWHKKQGHKIIVVSASFTNWLKPWCDSHDLMLLATELEVKENRITGKLASPNCKGPEKVNRIKDAVNVDDYDYIYAYGNSSGDKEMLELANEPFMNNFK